MAKPKPNDPKPESYEDAVIPDFTHEEFGAQKPTETRPARKKQRG